MQDARTMLLWLCVALALSVCAGMVWSILVHRRSVSGRAQPFHRSLYAELAWAFTPLLIVVAMLAQVLVQSG